MMTYMATVLPGLETVLADEIKSKIPGVKLLNTKRGKNFFESALPAENLLCLRTTDNLYRVICVFSAGLYRSDLHELERQIATCDLSFVNENEIGPDGFVVNASRKGAHTFSRFEAADAAASGIKRQYPHWRLGSPENHSLEFRLDLEDESALFSVRLTDSAFRFRGRSRLFAPAALRPTIAHALVWLSSPHADDRFIDPCCGSGTIVSERLAYPILDIRGGDLSEPVAQVARSNMPSTYEDVIKRWDARNIPLDNGWANKIVCNLPFGRQIGDRDQLNKLYPDLLQEISRLLQSGGDAILLTEEGALLHQAAEQSGLSCSESIRISLKGIQPAVYKLKK
ncbi:MAG: rRNA N2-methylase RlmL [Bacilli bacterium]|nr:rRNA N2-methylase RlmL [Bacilli bacterium]